MGIMELFVLWGLRKRCSPHPSVDLGEGKGTKFQSRSPKDSTLGVAEVDVTAKSGELWGQG